MIRCLQYHDLAWRSLLLPPQRLRRSRPATVIGTVKDAQGGVVPGATVTLISETVARSRPGHDRRAGDFVFPNVTADTYTVAGGAGGVQDR